jgi:AMP deaminase
VSNSIFAASPDHAVSPEFLKIFQAFETCLGLRDKYMRLSLQRLGDNPRDHDGYFSGLDPEVPDVSGVRPDAVYDASAVPQSPFAPWRIYPKPLPPHWRWTDATEPVLGASPYHGEEFVFGDCEIPGLDPRGFEIDEKGVFQVYEDVNGERTFQGARAGGGLILRIAQDKKPLYEIPTIREYFVDLEYVLGVISDGPSKSLAFRRLQYLNSKFEMHHLLNEFKEMADMKVSGCTQNIGRY